MISPVHFVLGGNGMDKRQGNSQLLDRPRLEDGKNATV
jgi:hypothetical protein